MRLASLLAFISWFGFWSARTSFAQAPSSGVPAAAAEQTTPPAAPPKDADQAAGGVVLMPSRVVLEGRERAVEVMLKNGGATPASFRVSIKEMEMLPNGKLQGRVKKDGEITAADLVRFTPRQVDLAPGESQIVRFQVRKPENLPEGEYRSHALFQGIPPAKPVEPITEDTEKRLSFSITQVMGISIPVIVRHGETRASIKLAGLRYWQPDVAGAVPVISLFLERSGNRSVVGDMRATVESGGQVAKGTLLTELKGTGIYTNLDRREVHLPMYFAKDGKLKGARIKVVFTATDLKMAPEVAYIDLAP
jgi:hypothetical protein